MVKSSLTTLSNCVSCVELSIHFRGVGVRGSYRHLIVLHLVILLQVLCGQPMAGPHSRICTTCVQNLWLLWRAVNVQWPWPCSRCLFFGQPCRMNMRGS